MPEIEISKIFTNNLKQLLEMHNMTYKELAENIGVKASSVSMWMNGNSLPRMGTLDKIADLFNVSVESLVTTNKEEDAATNEKDIARDKTGESSTIAAHFDGDEYTEAELEEIRKFAEFVKSKRASYWADMGKTLKDINKPDAE